MRISVLGSFVWGSFSFSILAGFLSAFSFSSAAVAGSCFQFEKLDTPARVAQTTSQVWCYETSQTAGARSLFIYKGVDSENSIAPELTALVKFDTSGAVESVSVGNLSQGRVQFMQLPTSELNPFPVPLTLEGARVRGKFISASTRAVPEVDGIVSKHLLISKKPAPSEIAVGTFSSRVPDAVFPFNGFWWSHAGLPMAEGPNSPLGLYDASIEARVGKNPHAADWESANHSDKSVSWGGHCNGWSASTALFPEPKQTLADLKTGRLYTPYAQKGLLAEAAYCVQTAFYGHRYYDSSDNLKDIDPKLFHQVLTYYIRDQGKTVIADYLRDASVDNNVIVGYQFHITAIANNKFHVNATLTYAQYDAEQGDSIGPASTYERKYAYTLDTDASGKLASGQWDKTSDNPDFMWVALSPAVCQPSNPNVNPFQVQNLLASLKPAVSKQVSISFSVKEELIPQGQIPLPVLLKSADHIRLQMKVRTALPRDTLLVASGEARYPITDGREESMFIPLTEGAQTVSLDRLLSVSSIAIVNQSTNASAPVDLQLTQLSYDGESI